MAKKNLPYMCLGLVVVGLLVYGFVDSNQGVAQNVAASSVPPLEVSQAPLFVPQALPPVTASDVRVPYRDDMAVCSGKNCKYAAEAKQLEKEVEQLERKSDLRDKQWEAWFRAENQWRRAHGFDAAERYEKGSKAIKYSDAVNDGFYGEGRPGTGAYGQSWVRSTGTVPVDCPNCNRRKF